jgi:hypothetical protein
MKTLLKTERVPAVAKGMGKGQPTVGVAWFELLIHEVAPDESGWDCSGGRTMAFWRKQFAERRDPATPWTVEAARMEGVPPAVIPPEVVQGLPDDARVEFVWHFTPAR